MINRFKFVYGLLLLIPTIALASVIPSDVKYESLLDFSGGLNTVVEPTKMDSTFSPDLGNVFVHRIPGSLISRNGFTLAGSSNVLADGRFMFQYNQENGNKYYEVSDGSVVLQTQDFQTYVMVSSGLTNTVNLSATQVRNKIWFTNSLDNVFTWDNSDRVKLDGTNGTPDVPKFRYIAFWQERVWGLSDSNNASALYFSSIISTDNIAIAPDDSRAWPQTNQLNIGQGDGQIGTSLWVYNGNLYVGKENSIYKIVGNNVYNYRAINVVPDVGVVSNDSIAILDNLTYFKSNKGIYKFNGDLAVRISDGIKTDMDLVNDSVVRSLSVDWETANDFNTGNYSNFGTTSTSDGLLTLTNDVIIANNTNIGDFSGLDVNTVISLNPGESSAFGVLKPTVPINKNFIGYVDYILLWSSTTASGANPTSVVIKNNISGKTQWTSYGPGHTGFALDTIDFKLSTSPVILISSSDISNNGLQISFGNNSVGQFNFFAATTIGNAVVHLTPFTTGQYISEIATISSINAWSQFNAADETNGGSINYFYKLTTAVVSQSSVTWNSISPGTIIPGSGLNNYIQWAATISAISSNTFPTIDSVNIFYLQGASNRDRPFATSWNNEYWLSIATASNNYSIQYVKSWNTNKNPDAWNRMYNMDLRSFLNDGDSVLYGGSANSGSFYRLDYGTNDNGNAIVSWYDTPRFVFGDPFLDKNLYEVWVDMEKQSNGNFNLGVSTNGANFYFNQISINGTGRHLKHFKTLSGTSKNSYQFRLLNNELDIKFAFYRMYILYQQTRIRSEL